MASIDQILQSAVENRVSDIHFSSGEAIWVRLDGDLIPYSEAALSHEELELMLFEILSEAEKTRLRESLNLDKSHFVEGIGNFRVNVFYSRRGIGSVIRTLPSKIPTIADLGLPEVVRGLAEIPKGLILVTGPTGSGKSTTLAAIIDHMNANFPYHILTAEDPVEFIHKSKKSLINQREIGQSCPTFAEALKYALREDPDVILVGEMRDLETISLALTAAETGHLVLGTLHTRGAAPTIDRIIESFPAMQQAMVRAMLAESLQAVISQTLIKRASGTGRVAAYEIMVMNYAISNLVREGKTFQIASAMQTARKDGMIQMEAHVRELAESGEIADKDAEELIASLTRGGHSQKSGQSASSTTSSTAPSKPATAPRPVEAARPPSQPAAQQPPAVPPAAAAVRPAMPAAPKVAAPAVPSPAPPVASKAPAPPAAVPAPSKPLAPPAAAPAVKAAPPEENTGEGLMSFDDLESDISDLSEMSIDGLSLDEEALTPKGPPELQGSKPPMKFKPLSGAAPQSAPAEPVTAAAPAPSATAGRPIPVVRPIPQKPQVPAAAPAAPAPAPAAAQPPKPAPPKVPIPPPIKKTG
jgi:twitching motility protein PilT